MEYAITYGVGLPGILLQPCQSRFLPAKCCCLHKSMLYSLIDRQFTKVKSEYMWNYGLVNFIPPSLMDTGTVLLAEGSSYWQGTLVQAGQIGQISLNQIFKPYHCCETGRGHPTPSTMSAMALLHHARCHVSYTSILLCSPNFIVYQYESLQITPAVFQSKGASSPI